MLHIKVFQGGATRIYNTNSFKLGTEKTNSIIF